MNYKHRPTWMTAFEARVPSQEIKENELRARNAFNRDLGTIVHSNFFKRLSHKTQVYSLPFNDHVHTRLTHSVEASQIGRQIARYFCRQVIRKMAGEEVVKEIALYNQFERELEELTAASCLAHDIGHPAFGHEGKEVIEAFCKEKGADIIFDDNKQVVRILLNDMWFEKIKVSGPFVASVLKKVPIDKNCYLSERDALEKILKKLNLMDCRHPASIFMEAADDISYLSADLLDFISIYSGSKSFGDMTKFEKFSELFVIDSEGIEQKESLKENFEKALKSSSDEIKQDFSDNFLRVCMDHVFKVIDTFANNFLSGSPTFESLPMALTKFIDQHAPSKGPKKDENLLYSKCVGARGEILYGLKNKIYYGAILEEDFISEQDKLAKVVLSSILSELYPLTSANKLEDVLAFRKLPDDAQKYLEATKKNGNIFQGIVDLVSGMTDRYAIAFWKDVAGLTALERMNGKPFRKTG